MNSSTPPARPAIRGGLLVGGASHRMGAAKQLLVHGGNTLAERAVAALGARCDEVVLLGAGEVPAALAELPRLADASLDDLGSATRHSAGSQGPLAGLLAALRHRPASAWIFAPCDLPSIRAEAVGWLAGQRRPGRAIALVRPTAGSPVDPLFSLYDLDALPLLEELAARGERAPRAVEGLPGVEVVQPPPHLADCWIGVNTPEELRAVATGESQES